MERIDLQFEVCKHAAQLLRDNCREKIESDQILDSALTVILETMSALQEVINDRKED